MTIMVRYEGQVVAVVGHHDAHLTPAVEALPDGDPTLRTILFMCEYALRAGQANPPRPYRDADALAYARGVLDDLLS